MIKSLMNRNNKTQKPVQLPAPEFSKSTQAWFPIKDVYNGFMHRRDGAIVAAIRVQPINLNLLSENEKLRKIKSLEEVFNGIDYPFQIISIARPVDLDAFINRLDMMKNNVQDRIKSKLLSGYINQAASMAIGGEAVERQFYILIDQPLIKKQQDEQLLYRKAVELASSLSVTDLASEVCNDDALRELLFIFTNPNQAAYERAPITSEILPSIFFEKEA